MSKETEKHNDQPAGERSCPDPPCSRFAMQNKKRAAEWITESRGLLNEVESQLGGDGIIMGHSLMELEKAVMAVTHYCSSANGATMEFRHSENVKVSHGVEAEP